MCYGSWQVKIIRTLVYGMSPPDNRSGTISVELTFTGPQGVAFLDLPPTHPFYNDIGKLSARGITVGCKTNNYGPNDAARPIR